MESSAHVAAVPSHDVGLWPFLNLTAQLGLLLLVIGTFNLEESHRFPELLPLIFGGFVLNAWLPLTWRPAFQVALTMGAVGLLFGPADGLRLAAIGLGLIGLCHLPVRFWIRVALIVVATTILVFVRLERIGAEWAPAVMPILGSIFMFRLAIYLYDLRSERTPVSVWHRIGYFFMLPNACFPLFPVVDYTTFHRGYYAGEARAIYQTGLSMILRGVTHLLVYRAIYYYVAPSPARIVDLNGLVLFMVTSWLLYLRISGLFHVITGILALFGYSLPLTHHLYFLASGFNDLWRRANIYWKDFMMKTFYYPVLMRVQHLGMATALTITILPLFLFSWMLHSWQWFWIRGEFPLRVVDAVFWSVFGVCVLLNSLLQLRRGRKRSLGRPAWSFSRALVTSVKVVATFLAMCVFWSFFISPTVTDWLAVMATGLEASAFDVARIAGLVVLAVGLGVAIQFLLSHTTLLPSGATLRDRWAGPVIYATSLALIVATSPMMDPVVGARAGVLAASLRVNRLSNTDRELLERGYYETLMAPPSFVGGLWEIEREQPDDWKNLAAMGLTVATRDLRRGTMLPNLDVTFKGARFRTNRWGVRDTDFTAEHPPGVYRAALMGGSHVLGFGVADHETFEQLVENRLNRAVRSGEFERYEILNLAKGGRTLVEHVASLDVEVFRFDPDVLLYTAPWNDAPKSIPIISEYVARGGEVTYPGLSEILRRAGVENGMKAPEVRRRLEPFTDAIAEWGYGLIAERCRARGVLPVWIYYPVSRVDGEPVRHRAEGQRLREIAQEAGFVILDLSGAYDGMEPSLLRVAPWDGHPNALAHRLLAQRLWDELLANEEALGLGLRRSAEPSRSP